MSLFISWSITSKMSKINDKTHRTWINSEIKSKRLESGHFLL